MPLCTCMCCVLCLECPHSSTTWKVPQHLLRVNSSIASSVKHFLIHPIESCTYFSTELRKLLACLLKVPSLRAGTAFSFSFLFLNKFIYLFIYGCVGSLLLRAGSLWLWRAGATLRCGARASQCSGFSCCGARALGAWASVVVAHGLSCSAACGNVPGPGLEPVSPALAGRFLTTAPPGKPCILFFYPIKNLRNERMTGLYSLFSLSTSTIPPITLISCEPLILGLICLLFCPGAQSPPRSCPQCSGKWALFKWVIMEENPIIQCYVVHIIYIKSYAVLS